MKRNLARGLGIANGNVERLLVYAIGPVKAERAMESIVFPPFLNDWEWGSVTRSELAMALQVVLFDDLLMDSLEGRVTLHDSVKKGKRLFLRRSYLLTARSRLNGALPVGEAAITRILGPLGYRFMAASEFDGGGAVKRMYAHADQSEALAGFVIGELDQDSFSTGFQRVVERVVASSTDPITPLCVHHLSELDRVGVLPLTIAEQVLLSIAGAFSRRHQTVNDSDVELLASESVEMASVARIGNAVCSVVARLTEASVKLDRLLAPSVSDDDIYQIFYRPATIICS